MSAIENVYNELSSAQRKRRRDNEKSRRRQELVGLAGSTLIGLYKAGMEDKAEAFFQNAEVIKGRNVYNKAQNLDKAFADHETNAATHITGEKGYVYDTFVMPYAQKLAEQEYAGWADGYTDESKRKVLKDFADKFQDDIYTKYKSIQDLRGRVDLSKNFEDFVKDANVFPDSMGQELIGKIFGNKRNKAEVLLASGENVLKQLSPDIFNLGGQKIFQEEGFENAKTFMEGASSGLAEKFKVTNRQVKMPMVTTDGTPEVTRMVDIEVSELDPLKVRFRDSKTREIIDGAQLKTTFLRKRKVITTDLHDKTVETYVYDVIARDGEDREYVIHSGQTIEASANSGILPEFNLLTDTSGLQKKTIIPFLNQIKKHKVSTAKNEGFLWFPSTEMDVSEVLKRQAEAYGEDAETYITSISRPIAAEVEKLNTIFPSLTSGGDISGLQMATRIVLNRRERKLQEDGKISESSSFHRAGNSGVAGAVNGLEALEAYADLVGERAIPINEESLDRIGNLLRWSKAGEQYNLLLKENNPDKINALKALFNRQSVRTLFSREFLEDRLAGHDPEKSERTIRKFEMAWEVDFGQPSQKGDKPPLVTEIDTVTGGGITPKPQPADPDTAKEDDTTDEPLSVLRTDTTLAPMEVVKAAVIDRDKSKYDVAVIGLGSMMDSFGRAVGQQLIEDSPIGKVYSNKQEIYDFLKLKVDKELMTAVYKSVFIPPSKRDSSEPISVNKLEAVVEGLNKESQHEIIDAVTTIAKQEEGKKDTGASLLQRPDEDAITIPDSVEDKVEFVGNIFNDGDKEIEFMKRLVNQESLFGKAPGTYTLAGKPGRRGSYGVAQVDEVAFNQVLKKLNDRRNRLAKYVEPFEDATGIDLREVKYEDLDNDILSIAFGRMYLRQRTNAPIPKSKPKQGDYWKKYYNTSSGSGTANDFVQTNADRL